MMNFPDDRPLLAEEPPELELEELRSRASQRQNVHSPEEIPSGDEDAGYRTRLLPQKRPTSIRYAKVGMLGKYIPEVDPENPRAQTFRVELAKRTTMLRVQIGIALLVMALNIGCIIAGVVVYRPNSKGVGTIRFGSCHDTSTINTLLHGAINILSSLLLGAGSYCMQLLVGPSRQEMDRAHSKGKSMEIGVASIKNLRHIAGKRVVLWLFLGISSTLLHFFWNSTVFTSTPVVSVPRAVATSDFQVRGDNWTATDPLAQRSWWGFPGIWGDVPFDLTPLYSMQTAASNMTRLEPSECISRFVNPWTATQNLVLVAQNVSSAHNNGSSLIDGWMSGWDIWTNSHAWICSQYPQKASRACTEEWASTFADNWIVAGAPISEGSPVRENVAVDYCLVGESVDIDNRCGLHFSVYLTGIVCFFTAAEALLIWLTWLNHTKTKSDPTGRRQETMVTMGDAISDFLERPDELAAARDSEFPRASYTVRVGRWREECVSWFKGVSTRTWVISITVFSLAITMTTYSVISTIIWLKNSKIPIGPSRIWSQGFKPSWEMVIYNGWGKKNNNLSDFMTNVLIANSFQVGLSFLYLFYNNILTRQLLADEWVRFVQVEGKKPLRVSAPVGMQRSSYSLTLPFKYSIPLMVASILMHWLISQSIFLVQTSAYDPGPNGGHNPAFDVSARGYSILGTILAISTGFVLVLVIIVHAWVRKYQGMPSGFQRMATDSAAISLMCLRPEGDTEAHLFPVRIGAVADQGAGSKMKRIAFSTDIDMEKPEDNGQYLLPQLIPKPKGSWGVRVGRLFGNGKGSTQ